MHKDIKEILYVESEIKARLKESDIAARADQVFRMRDGKLLPE